MAEFKNQSGGGLTVGGQEVIKVWESFQGWYWFAVEDQGSYQYNDIDGTEKTAHTWYGFVQGSAEEWGTWDSNELERNGVWTVPKSNWHFTGRRDTYESRANESTDYGDIGGAKRKVTYLDNNGQQKVGRAVMKGPAGWVVNGGNEARPDLVDEGNFISVESYAKEVNVTKDIWEKASYDIIMRLSMLEDAGFTEDVRIGFYSGKETWDELPEHVQRQLSNTNVSYYSPESKVNEMDDRTEQMILDVDERYPYGFINETLLDLRYFLNSKGYSETEINHWVSEMRHMGFTFKNDVMGEAGLYGYGSATGRMSPAESWNQSYLGGDVYSGARKVPEADWETIKSFKGLQWSELPTEIQELWKDMGEYIPSEESDVDGATKEEDQDKEDEFPWSFSGMYDPAEEAYGDLLQSQKKLVKDHFQRHPDILRYEDFDYDTFMEIYNKKPSEFLDSAVNHYLDELVWGEESKPQSKEGVREDCPWCNGTGKSGEENLDCSHCHGVGKIHIGEGQGGTYGRDSYMLNPEHTDITQCIVCGRNIDDHSNPSTDYRGMFGTAPETDHYFQGGSMGDSDDKYDFESKAKEFRPDRQGKMAYVIKGEFEGKSGPIASVGIFDDGAEIEIDGKRQLFKEDEFKMIEGESHDDPLGDILHDWDKKDAQEDDPEKGDPDYQGYVDGEKKFPSQWTLDGMDHGDTNRGDIDFDALESIGKESLGDEWWWKHVKWESGYDQDLLNCKQCGHDIYTDAYNTHGNFGDDAVREESLKHLRTHGIGE